MIGQTISHYKIIEKLGEGGMGVVYKAQDTILDRFVALKFLPDHLKNGSNELERFMQEAKAAASLNHPNICTIYGIEESEGKHFIVMEFVDGQTLQERKMTLSQKQALDIGIQIAEGLSAAHEKGIVHRDIKPENIMIRKDGLVQVMDFGLAKLRGASRLTKEGSTVGTAGYMSPEQVQGQDTDHRSDIFSLGVLLYEMLAGQIPFKGVHETAIAYEIVNVDSAPMSTIKPDITPELDAVILECLEKDPKERAQSASQIALDLKRCRRESSRSRASRTMTARPNLSASRMSYTSNEIAQSAENGSVRKKNIPWLIIPIVAVVMLGIGFSISKIFIPKTMESPTPVISATIALPGGLKYNDGLGGHSAISPDGSMFVFAGIDSMLRLGLWVRPLNSAEAKMLAGTENAQYPFWSYDSRTIGFFADGKLKTIDSKGGPVMTLADAPFGRGAAWSSSGEIIFCPSVIALNLVAVAASGGTPREVTHFDSTTKSVPRFPFMLPDGDHFIFSMITLGNNATHTDLYAGSLKDGTTKKILDESSFGIYASGVLFSLRQGTIMAQPFDSRTLSVTGKPTAVQGNVNSWTPRGKADFSVSENGLLVYTLGGSARASELFWIDRHSTSTPIGNFDPFLSIRLSPDNTKIAYDQIDAKGEQPTVWIFDIATSVRTRLTFGQDGGSTPVWSRDGTTIYFNADLNGSKANIFMKRSDGSGEVKLFLSGTDNSVGYVCQDVSPDGRYLLVSVGNESGKELGVVDLSDTVNQRSLQKLQINGANACFSPDGKWIAYNVNESGTAKMYVSSFKGIEGKWLLPTDGASSPYWVKNRIIYYSNAHDSYEGCDVSFPKGSPVFGQPSSLFASGRSQNAYLYGVTNDGDRFLGFRPANAGVGSNISLLVNWKGLIDAE
jgi:serine/threonine protein kinase